MSKYRKGIAKGKHRKKGGALKSTEQINPIFIYPGNTIPEGTPTTDLNRADRRAIAKRGKK